MNDDGYTLLLTDEEGSEIECEVLDRVELEGSSFLVLLPVDEDSSEPEAIVLREDAEGELHGLEDGDLLDRVFTLFLEKNGLNN